MLASLRIPAVLMSASVSLSCQTSKIPNNNQARSQAVTVPSLGIRYTPPPGLADKTSAESRQLRDRAADYATKMAMPILDMSSDDSDTSPEWHQMWIALFPRAQISSVTDEVAEGKVSTALAGPRAKPIGQSQSITVGGQKFLVSEFTQEEPPLLKRAKIYTTIRKTQLVSFVFVANSPDPVKTMEESLKTLDFSTP